MAQTEKRRTTLNPTPIHEMERQFIEFTYLTILDGDFSLERLLEHIRALGAERVILTSDLGQDVNPFLADGLAEFIRLVLKSGITEKEIERMIVVNPAALVE